MIEVSPKCSVSGPLKGGLDWVAMEWQHRADLMAIVKEDEEEEMEAKGKGKVE